MKIRTISLGLVLLFLTISCEIEEPIKNCIDPERIRSGACNLDYSPVCGCDSKTYGNACAADLAGITFWTEGACN